MLKFKNRPNHECAPKDWRTTPIVTGDPDFDGSLVRSTNGDVPARLKLYLLSDETGYGPRTGYAGYSGYSGDD
jgi:hypothetical protein